MSGMWSVTPTFAFPEECELWWGRDTYRFHWMSGVRVSSCGYDTTEHAMSAAFVLLDQPSGLFRGFRVNKTTGEAILTRDDFE